MKSLLLICFCVLVFSTLICDGKDWWENGNFYQIYPRSFRDSDGDGIGDINGITEKLPYLKELGITGVWLSPIFQSPMVDFGYDISDYLQIHPEYGTMNDFRQLISKAKEIGLKIILDLVPNHSSDQHEWFQKSIQKIEPYTNYYIWEDGIIDKNNKRQPPSNWISVFRYSAWEWNNERQQYYLHQFAKQQPDLNYRNDNVVQEMKNIIKFWLNQGISGFRIDAIPFLYEKEKNPKTNQYYNEIQTNSPTCKDSNDYCYLIHNYTIDQPETYDMVYQWRQLCDQYKKLNGGDTKVLMTEAYTSLTNTIRFYGDEKRPGSQIPFNFQLISNTNNQSKAIDYSNNIDSWLNNMPKNVFANWVLGNHDQKRIATRYGIQRIDLFNILLQTLPGNAITYNGEEIGMTDVYISWKDTVDPQACNTDENHFNDVSRDPARTPFQWDASNNAGFSSGSKTWLPVAKDYQTNNVLIQSRTPISHLQIFKKLVRLRQEPAFQDGTFEKTVQDENVLIYKREKEGNGDIYVVILNFGKKDVKIDLKKLYAKLSDKIEIITTSIHSKYTDGEQIEAKSFTAYAEVGTVVASIKKL